MANITHEMIEKEFEFWLSQCMKSDRLDRDKARKAVAFCRKELDLSLDAPVYFVDGPLSAYFACFVLEKNPNITQGELDKEVKARIQNLKPGKTISVQINYDISKWVGWVAYYKMGLDYEFPEEWKNFPEFRKYCDEVVFEIDGMINEKHYTVVIERPLFYKTHGESHELHCEDGPAVEFRDGSKAFFLNGYRVPSWAFRDKRDQSFVKRVLEIENTDVRAEVVGLVGADLFYDKMDKTELDSGEIGGRPYSLFDVKLENEYLGRFLKMTGPSTGKPYFERVLDQCETIVQANAWADNQLNWRKYYIEPDVLT